MKKITRTIKNMFLRLQFTPAVNESPEMQEPIFDSEPIVDGE